MNERSIEIVAKIRARLDFVPPFFGPAFDDPSTLASLWQQTESAYLDNPLPTLFKEQLAALLGRYCEVPYCLVCHSCTLLPLGMEGKAIAGLLARESPTEAVLRVAAERIGARGTIAFPIREPILEEDVSSLACALYFGGTAAERARATLKRHLRPRDFNALVLFVSYNRSCHEWMAAHPEVSYELDRRYLQSFATIAAEAPEIARLLGTVGATPPPFVVPTARVIERSEGASATASLSEDRILGVLRRLEATVRASEAEGKRHERAQDLARELVAIVSHDLRDPLGVVLVGATFVADTHADLPSVAVPLRRVVAATKRAERLVHDLLDFSQARAGGGIPLHLAEVDVRELVAGAVDDVRTLHPDRVVELTHEGDGSASVDPDRFAQILSNLLGNAIAHGAVGAPVRVSLRTSASRLVLAVENGNASAPISAALKEVLFDPFARGAARATSGKRSIGLGLYIVDQLVLGHRGRIDVVSSDAGTTFTVVLPRRPSSPPIDRAP